MSLVSGVNLDKSSIAVSIPDIPLACGAAGQAGRAQAASARCHPSPLPAPHSLHPLLYYSFYFFPLQPSLAEPSLVTCCHREESSAHAHRSCLQRPTLA